jgi:hypothetical protein
MNHGAMGQRAGMQAAQQNQFNYLYSEEGSEEEVDSEG